MSKRKLLWTGLALFACAGWTQADEVETWRVYEQAFTSGKDYAEGGGDAVVLDVAFTRDGANETLVRPGFWDGGATFRVRFAPPAAGVWIWRTTCADDAALNGLSGSVTAVPYRGTLEIYRRGFVRTEPGKKHFTYADGTPFFYLGDTHWGLYKEEIDAPGPHAGTTGATSHHAYVVNRRAEQGFTVYQTEPIGAAFNAADGTVDASDIPGFQLADRYYQVIADAGLVHANAEFFFAASMCPPLAQNPAALARLARYWVARFGAYPVLWTLGQEVDNDFYYERGAEWRQWNYANNPWVAVAAAIHACDAYRHPLSAHQENTAHTTVTGRGTQGDKSKISGDGRSSFADEAVAARTGHSWWAAQWGPPLTSPVNWEVPRDYRASARPAVNYEGRYCYLWTKDFGARLQGWVAFLTGFCGYGYGAIDMWLYQSTYDIDRVSRDGVDVITVADKAVPWSTAIEFPSARQMGYLKSFLTALPWWELEPDLGDKTLFVPDKDCFGVCAAKKGELYVLYFYSRATATGTLQGLAPGASYAATWFNPRTGEVGTTQPLAGAQLPSKPDGDDWVLTVRRFLLP